MLAKIVTLAVLSAGLTSVQAQEQTVESAQKFLEQVLTSLRADTRMTQNRHGKISPSRRYGDIKKVESVARCQTKITVSYDRHISAYDTDMVPNQSGRLVRGEWGPWTGAYTLDATKLTEVSVPEKSKNTIRVHTTDNSETVVFIGTAESLVARVAFAMDFLRQKCDATAATGF